MPYPEEYKRQLVELVQSGRSAESLAEEFEPSAKTIRAWAQKAGVMKKRLHGKRAPGTAPEDKDLETEVKRLRRENARLLEEREILREAGAWFAMEAEGGSKRRSRSWRRTGPNIPFRCRPEFWS